MVLPHCTTGWQELYAIFVVHPSYMPHSWRGPENCKPDHSASAFA